MHKTNEEQLKRIRLFKSDLIPFKLLFRSSYVHEFMLKFYQAVPIGDRAWSKKDRIWICDAKHFKAVLDLAKHHFDEIEDRFGQPEPAHSAAQATIIPKHLVALEVLASAAPLALKSLYREAAKQAHPDTGGSAQWMQKVNQAWGIVQQNYKIS